MSTVAYKDGIIAGDTMMSFGSELIGGVRKVGRTENFLFGYVGQMSGMYRMYKWVNNLPEYTDPNDFYEHADTLNMGDIDGSAILISRTEDIWALSAAGGMILLRRAYESVGSGSTYALGALASGASAIEAVKTAITLDAYTGGKVETVTFKDPISNPAHY
jgi:ATP-dependent protease HslVU (ClpYQ) peptidase subunit